MSNSSLRYPIAPSQLMYSGERLSGIRGVHIQAFKWILALL
jgi:hypothetical protein